MKTIEEIRRALAMCTRDHMCDECLYYNDDGTCVSNLMCDALALINKLGPALKVINKDELEAAIRDQKKECELHDIGECRGCDYYSAQCNLSGATPIINLIRTYRVRKADATDDQ